MTETTQVIDGAAFAERITANARSFYGCHATWIGDDGEILVFGHPGPRRALAAANKMARSDGLDNLCDDKFADYDALDVAERWALPGHSEDCPLVEAFRAWCDKDRTFGDPPVPVVECGDEIKPGQECKCAEGGDSWWIRYVPRDTPGAFPITTVGF